MTMEATATMLPRTVMNDRSLLAQMACTAMAIDSRSCCMTLSLVHFARDPACLLHVGATRTLKRALYTACWQRVRDRGAGAATGPRVLLEA